MADRDIEQAADQAANDPDWAFYPDEGDDPLEVAHRERKAAAEYVRITRRELDGTAKGPLEWDDIWAADLDDPGPLAADDLDEQETPC